MQPCQFHNFQLQYPEDWEAIEEDTEEGEVSLTLQDDATAFWILSLYDNGPTPEELVEAAIEFFREEYDDVDIYPVESKICGETAVAKEVEFVYLDLISTACFRAFRIGEIFALIYFQDAEPALETTRPLFDAITESLSYIEFNPS